MSFFFAQVPVSPVGYRWEGLEDLATEDLEDEDFTQSVMLQAANHDEIIRDYQISECLHRGKTYDPFVVEPALFRIFAAMPYDPDSILKFANRYGDIAWAEDVVEEGGFSLLQWQNHIVKMQDFVEESDKFANTTSSKAAKARAEEACDFINMYLGPRTFLSASVQSGNVMLRTVAVDLLAVMMIQLALSITEQKHYRACDFCGKPFELTPQVNRSDRLFCTDNCRVKAYQRRKKQVLELHLAGRTLKQIAKTTGAEMKTVKKWIDSLKNKET